MAASIRPPPWILKGDLPLPLALQQDADTREKLATATAVAEVERKSTDEEGFIKARDFIFPLCSLCVRAWRVR